MQADNSLTTPYTLNKEEGKTIMGALRISSMIVGDHKTYKNRDFVFYIMSPSEADVAKVKRMADRPGAKDGIGNFVCYVKCDAILIGYLRFVDAKLLKTVVNDLGVDDRRAIQRAGCPSDEYTNLFTTTFKDWIFYKSDDDDTYRKSKGDELVPDEKILKNICEKLSKTNNNKDVSLTILKPTRAITIPESDTITIPIEALSTKTASTDHEPRYDIKQFVFTLDEPASTLENVENLIRGAEYWIFDYKPGSPDSYQENPPYHGYFKFLIDIKDPKAITLAILKKRCPGAYIHEVTTDETANYRERFDGRSTSRESSNTSENLKLKASIVKANRMFPAYSNEVVKRVLEEWRVILCKTDTASILNSKVFEDHHGFILLATELIEINTKLGKKDSSNTVEFEKQYVKSVTETVSGISDMTEAEMQIAELELQLRFERKFMGAPSINPKCRLDIISSELYLEIEHWTKSTNALTKLVNSRGYYPKRQAVVHFFGRFPNILMALPILRKFTDAGIQVTWDDNRSSI